MHCCCMSLNGSAQLTTTAMHKYQVTERNEIDANALITAVEGLSFLDLFFFRFVNQHENLRFKLSPVTEVLSW